MTRARPNPPPTPLSATPGAVPPSCSVPDAALAKQLGLDAALLQALMELPGTRSVWDLKSRLASLAEWNASLRK